MAVNDIPRLTDLPPELLALILGRTSGGTILKLAPEHSTLHQLAQGEDVWERLRQSGRWEPNPLVKPIIRAGAHRDAFRVEVMEKKVDWDTLNANVKALQAEVQKLTTGSAFGRGAALNATIRSPRLQQTLAALRKATTLRDGLQAEIKAEGLAVTKKGWRRQWG